MLIDDAKIITLLNGCRKNDRNSQRELYYSLRGFAMKICYRYTSSNEEPEHIVNEGFLTLFKDLYLDETLHSHTLLSLKHSFKSILVDSCIEHYRKHNASVKGLVMIEESKSIANDSETGIDVLSHKEIIEGIRLLAPTYRTIFNLYMIDGWSHTKISEKLGISETASQFILMKARDALRKLLLTKLHFKVYVSPRR